MLNRLAPSVDAGYRAAINEKKSRLHEGTRTEVLDFLDNWVSGSNPECGEMPILFMRGEAGIGLRLLGPEDLRDAATLRAATTGEGLPAGRSELLGLAVVVVLGVGLFLVALYDAKGYADGSLCSVSLVRTILRLSV